MSSFIKINDSSETFGNLPSVKRFIKGVFGKRPYFPLKDKVSTWDTTVVLKFLESWYPNEDLNLKELTLKLTMLLALLSGQRCQTIHSLNTKNMKLSKDKCIFYVFDLLKHSKRGSHQEPIQFLAFPDNPAICILRVLTEYVNRTNKLKADNGETKLLISHQKPHKAVSKDTVCRWIKEVLKLCDIDIQQYTAHSTRSASTSAATKAGLPLATIMSAAGWSRENTFTMFYKKEVKNNFGQSLMDSFMKTKESQNIN